MQPDLTVVVVSDYESGPKSWHDEHAMLAALARQDLTEPFVVCLVENESARGTVPASLAALAPGLRLVFSTQTRSSGMKDDGVRQTGGRYVAVVEADSLPDAAWLRTLLEFLRNNPDAAAASGQTTYGNRSMWRRSLSLIDRSLRKMEPGPTSHVSNNGAIYRREVLEQFPYPQAVNAFRAASERNAAMRQAGHRFVFTPDAQMQHAIGGWSFLRDYHRNNGYAHMKRFRAQRISGIPRLMLGRLRSIAERCWRHSRRYLRWYDYPLTLMLMVAVVLLEVPGMLDAIHQREQIPGSSYR